MNMCKVKDCKNVMFCKNFCMKHYSRYKKTGDPLKTISGKIHGIRRICVINNCEGFIEGNSYCHKHNRRYKLYGNTNTKKIDLGKGWHINNGYVVLRKPNYSGSRKDGSILEHRYVMEQKLGRELKSYEIVHHKNGRKTDNRQENLELKTRKTHHTGNGDYDECPKCGYKY